MNLAIEKRAALVCGASDGIGLACARGLAAEGVRVVLVARREDLLQRRVGEIREEGGEASFIGFDLTRIDELDNLARRAESLFGGIDILVNNNGGPPGGADLSFGREGWEEAFRLSFLSTAMLTRALISGMSERKWGRIVNLTSVSVKQPIEGLILSNSIRMSVVGFAKTLSRTFAASNVTINTIATGYTDTERLRSIFDARAKREGVSFDEIARAARGPIPAGRFARPEEIASLVVFLAGEGASYITGTTIPVDGGYVSGM
jgi:3-oxoacyl-[acyl-carrier protein] reductase